MVKRDSTKQSFCRTQWRTHLWTPDWTPVIMMDVSSATDLQVEGQKDIRLGQDLCLLSNVQEGVVEWGALQPLFEVRPPFSHRQTLKVGHEQVDGWVQLLHIKRLHVCRHKSGKCLLLEKVWNFSGSSGIISNAQKHKSIICFAAAPSKLDDFLLLPYELIISL